MPNNRSHNAAHFTVLTSHLCQRSLRIFLGSYVYTNTLRISITLKLLIVGPRTTDHSVPPSKYRNECAGIQHIQTGFKHRMQKRFCTTKTSPGLVSCRNFRVLE